MSSLSPVHGPAQFDIVVHLIHTEDDDKRAEVTIGMGVGKYPTQQDIADRIAKFEAEEMPKVSPGYRLQTAPELFDTICLEKAGGTFTTPAVFRQWAPLDR
ncbi:hypothetical protein [Halopseudomonas pertucinogena]|uniref:Uncharacterized protein n=1 Tax=Halopseudomonas pertucinogena TaxID=86175 RepID=A0ABQ2CRM5_9GAMM|nr:hypothetical protein [Halopseudomonas pertucinogena]GGJ06301.1 hypothetical protein GCM10009083_24080 [Halopseudomonas pertucinogena]